MKVRRDEINGTTRALQRELRRLRSADAAYVHRLVAVLLVLHGQTCKQVANWFGESRTAVQRWVRLFKARSLEGLQGRERSGRPRRLDSERWEAVQKDLQT